MIPLKKQHRRKVKKIAKPKAKPKAKATKAAKEATQVPDDGAATAGTTNLGALLKAKLDSKNNE